MIHDSLFDIRYFPAPWFSDRLQVRKEQEMSPLKRIQIMSDPLPNIPWEDRPAGCADVVWRSARNPIVGRHDIPDNNSIFNSAVVPWKRGFKGIFRCDGTTLAAKLHTGESASPISSVLRFPCA
jgi:hypothetical protein